MGERDVMARQHRFHILRIQEAHGNAANGFAAAAS